jgi:hypothetical protein
MNATRGSSGSVKGLSSARTPWAASSIESNGAIKSGLMVRI